MIIPCFSRDLLLSEQCGETERSILEHLTANAAKEKDSVPFDDQQDTNNMVDKSSCQQRTLHGLINTEMALVLTIQRLLSILGYDCSSTAVNTGATPIAQAGQVAYYLAKVNNK